MHVIMGLPRSGSTLLCNILAQNPNFQVEHTNILPGLLSQMVGLWSNDPNIKGALGTNPEATVAKVYRCAKGLCDAWNNTDKVVFNKSRGWAHNILLLKKIYPDAKVIVTIRDLREIFASFERQHQKNPLFEQGLRPILQRARNIFSGKGMVGSALVGIEDILHRKQNVFFLKYEDFVRHPDQMMERLYCYLDLPTYEHDFENVVNTATDPDHLYLNKFPHKGEGKVEPKPATWPKVISETLAQGIVNGQPWFFEEFKYIKPQKLPPKQRKKPIDLTPDDGDLLKHIMDGDVTLDALSQTPQTE